ncbi:EamA family transporter [Sphingomonas sp. 1P08PE]|uniref:EamA family transporter n=1 Tax=Sphingomonas sp. 1P08PE TaxID=554122 RepID=UPI0039A248DD
MTIGAALLVVFAAIIHATWNLLAKRAAAVGPVFVFAYNLVSCVVYAPWMAYQFVHGDTHWDAIGIGIVLLSGAIHLAYSLCLQRGYQVADLSVVYPVARGTGPMLATVAAVLVLGEAPTGRSLTGLALIVVGIGLIATQGDVSAFRRPGGRAGVRWGTATGGLIASYTVVDAYAVKTLGIVPVVLDWFANLLRFCLLAPLIATRPRQALASMRGFWWNAVGVGILSPLGYILVLAALSFGAPLSVVAPMRELSMMIGAVLGMIVLREAVGPWRLAGCAVLIAGVILLSTT